MTANLSKCTDEKHRFQARLFCEHQDCESLLCLGCFQTHKEDTGCEGEFGVHILEIGDVVEEETPEVIAPKTDPKRKMGSVIQQHTLKKTKLLERIERVIEHEGEIHQENGKKLDKFEADLIEYLTTRNRQWRSSQANILRKRSEAFGAEIFSRLENIRETLDNMEFDENKFSNNSQIFKNLNRKIAIEAEQLIGLAEKAMASWNLNKDRLDDYSKTLIKVLNGIGFSSLLHDDELVYDVPDLSEFSEDLKRQNEELKTLKAEDGMLRAWINRLQNENKELKDLSPKNEELTKEIEKLKEDLESVTEERDEFDQKIAQLEKEIQVLVQDKAGLVKVKDQLDQEKSELSDAKDELENERDVLKGKVEALTKDKADLLKAKDQLTQDKDEMKDAKDELENERDGLKTKLETLEKEKLDLTKVKVQLTQENNELSDEKDKLQNERDGLKTKVEALEKDKVDLVSERDQLNREKAELAAKNKELEEKSSSA